MILKKLSQATDTPNFNQKTTTHHPTTNSKLHERARLERYIENKSCQTIYIKTKKVFRPQPHDKNSPVEHKKAQNDPLKAKKRSENQKSYKTRLSYYYVAAIFFVYFHFFFFIAIVFVVLLLLLLISLLLIYFSIISFFFLSVSFGFFFDIFLLFYFDLFLGSTDSSEKIVSLLMYMQLYSFKY